jgi:hypothetical protein
LCLGLAGGLYHFIRSSMAAMREAATADQGADQAAGRAADQITEKDS